MSAHMAFRGSFGHDALQSKVQQIDQEQSRGEHGDARQVVHEALSSRLPRVIGQQDQDQHPDEIGGNGDRHHGEEQERGVAKVLGMPDVEVEDRPCRQ